MKPSSQRALIWLLSLVAVLAPAAAIAYLGAVSYRGERGAVAARLEEQLRVAQRLAARVEQALARSVDDAEVVLADSRGRPDAAAVAALAAHRPLARAPFWVSDGGALMWPAPAPLGGDHGDDLGRAAETCAERGLEACIRDAQTTRRRDAQLAAARVAEVDGRRSEARRAYQTLARFDDTGPEATLALARMARLGGDRAAAEAHLRAIERRFPRGRVDGVPLEVLVALARAELAARAGQARPALDLYRALVERRHGGPPAALVAIAERTAAALHALTLDPASRQEVAALDERFAAARAAARRARALAPDVADLARTATGELAGRPSLVDASQTVAFRRARGGGVIGVVVDTAALASAAGTTELAAVARGARASVTPVGAARPSNLRILAAVPLGAALPHLTLEVVNDRADPDPLDDVIRQRSRRHLLVTGGLALVLAAGVLATIRGATRERELARLKSDFVSTVSHELKTPLTSIRMFAEMLEQGVAGGDAERVSRYHGIIVKESQRLGLLIANLLDYAQIERGSRRYQVGRARVDRIAADAVETFARLRGDAAGGHDGGVRVEVAAAAVGAEALVDRDVWLQAVLNLLANAAKYGGPGMPITVRVERTSIADRDHVAIRVIDQGPGIPASEQPRIFREFYRAPAAYSSGVEGTGLGLALVKRHVEAQGGTVSVESQPGRGAAFTIAVPALTPATETETGTETETETETKTETETETETDRRTA
jgi:signal transduction histidine kinase